MMHTGIIGFFQMVIFTHFPVAKTIFSISLFVILTNMRTNVNLIDKVIGAGKTNAERIIIQNK